MSVLKRFTLAIVFAFSIGIVASQDVRAEVTNYPNGVSSFGMTIIPNVGGEVYTGNVWFVDSSDGDGSDSSHEPGNRLEPFSTLDFAIGRANTVGGADNGDVIYVLPGHTESITAASGSGSLTFDIDGQTIINLGKGANRPTYTISGTHTNRINVTGDNVTIVNGLFRSGTMTVAINVTGDDVSLINNETRDIGGETGSATDWIVATTTARFSLINHTHRGTSTAPAVISEGAVGTRTSSAPATFLLLSSATDTTVRGGYIYGNFGNAAIEGTWTAGAEGLSGSERVRIYGTSDNPLFIWNENSTDILVTMTAGSSGYIGPNIMGRLADNAANLTGAVQGLGMHFHKPIELVNSDNESSTSTTIISSSN